MSGENAVDPTCFNGPERLGYFAPLGRSIRQGASDQLAVADFDRISAAFRAGNVDASRDYFQLVASLHLQLGLILFEWSLEWTTALANKLGSEQERLCTNSAFLDWRSACASIAGNREADAAVEVVSRLLSPEFLKPGLSVTFRSAPPEAPNPVPAPLVAALASRRDAVIALLERADFHAAHRLLESYWHFASGVHDALVQYCHAYPSRAAVLFGQDVAESLLRDSFSSASFFEGLWAMGALPPLQLAAFLAEHLRAHFSGPRRGGSVRVIEHPDRYQLIFDGCGSGQEMRRRLQRCGLVTEKFAQASPATWHRAGEVPAYCSHCAFNELESIRRFGYPVLVTEFDPDPDRPCGWTVYKDPRLIPEEYFARLGERKITSRFPKSRR
jgi:hypothetical protein